MIPSSQPKVSIIMPAYNAEKYVKDAIESVINQDTLDWELIIIDDGSTDSTLDILKTFEDNRVQVIENDHVGVSATRNLALEHCKGHYICFFDSDDILPPNSISIRATMLDEDPTLEFVDGVVVAFNSDMTKEKARFTPSFQGKVTNELIRFRSSCFFGPTWMVRKKPDKTYRFREDITHGEDLHFFLSISEGGLYNYTTQTVLYYRKHPASAMNNLRGMENGLFAYLKAARRLSISSFGSKLELKYRLTRAVSGSYFHNNEFYAAFRTFFKFIVS